nr:mpv17-like protein 2 [Lepeophtheirus salmonis]XP_040576922.1 mpv17-like protein 2 [Lepeophtheirus salmonis]
MNFFRNIFSHRYLLLTNVFISTGLSAIGDICQQKLESSNKKYNASRTLLMASSFGLTSGILCHYWYIYLDKILPSRKGIIIFKKVIIDQIIFSPILILTCLSVAGLIERKKLDSFWSHISEKGVKLYIAEWFVWPPAQFVNFYFLPTRYRVAYDNLISLGYDGYISKVKHE